jgi:hypothetical protein
MIHPAPFLIAVFDRGEGALPLVRAAATMADAVELAGEVASRGLVRVYAVDADRLVVVLTTRVAEGIVPTGHA